MSNQVKWEDVAPQGVEPPSWLDQVELITEEEYKTYTTLGVPAIEDCMGRMGYHLDPAPGQFPSVNIKSRPKIWYIRK